MEPVFDGDTVKAAATFVFFSVAAAVVILDIFRSLIHNSTSISPRYDATGPKGDSLTDPAHIEPISITVDPSSQRSLADQIYLNIRGAIDTGQLPQGTRLPSGRDLAIQLGVARGTVRAAYERLAHENLVESSKADGTRVNTRRSVVPAALSETASASLMRFSGPHSAKPLPFKMGVPAYDVFPAKLWSRMRSTAVRADALMYWNYSDPRGEQILREQIASHVALSRQIVCHPDQVFITGGYRQGLQLALTSLGARGGTAWVEEPGYPVGLRALELAGLTVSPVPVDDEGICVAQGIVSAPSAVVALVTPGQQAPTGVVMSAKRRSAILEWAIANDASIIEDDYLSELKLDGRAQPALASMNNGERVIYLGSFSKTISPALGLGFMVAPRSLVPGVLEATTMTAPAPNRTTQLALAEFISGGHYLRHLRKMKAVYSERRALLAREIRARGFDVEEAGLALILHLSNAVDDVALAQRGVESGIAPFPLSPYYHFSTTPPRGLLLGVSNVHGQNVDLAIGSLDRVLGGF